jgi:O-antigen/teichoic acid export membrane protein
MSIERKAMSALRWATAAKLVIQVASWAGTLIIVRLLTPEDYGLMAKVAVVCAIAGAIAEFGLEAAIVRAVDVTRDDLRKIFGVSLALGAGMTMAVAAMAPAFALLFQEQRLIWPIAAASLQIIVGAVSVVPKAMATRELLFRRLSAIEMAAAVAGIGATLILAVWGAGVWALVLGSLLGAITRSISLLALGERVSPLFSLRGIGEHLRFGLTVAGNRVSYFIVVQSDVIIGSAFLSTTEIGQYSVALQLATLPMAKVMGTINQIALPAVARQQDDLPRLRQSVLKAIGLIALFAFPTLWGVSAVAPELVRVLFGPKWIESIPALVILPLIVPVRMVCGVLFTTSLALGNRQLDLRNTIINFVLLPSGFFVGAHWGLLGLCSAWLVSVPLAYAFSVPAVLTRIGIRGRDLVSECGAPAASAAVMYAAVAALRLALDGQPSILALLALSAVGAIVYIALIALGSRRHLVIARNFARSLISRDAASTAN